MVLHLRQHDLIPFLQLRGEGIRSQVERFCRVLGEDDLFHAGRIDESRGILVGFLIELGRLLPKIMDRTVHVCVMLAVIPIHCPDDLHRLLRRRGIVHVHEGLSVDPLVQDGKILPYFFNRELHGEMAS